MKVRDALTMLKADGWYLVVTDGSHRQFKHRKKVGRVTVAGKPNDDLPPTSRSEEMKKERICYAIVIEKADNNYAAYVPDLPGCVATGQTRQETEHQIRQAIELHLRGMREDGLPIPEPVSRVEYVEVPA